MSQEIYVKEMPKNCIDCNFAYDGKCQATEQKESYCIENCRRSDCPLKLLHDHDIELVAKVLKTIKEKAFGLWYFVLHEHKKHFDNNRYVLSEKDFNEILDQIQQEFENE